MRKFKIKPCQWCGQDFQPWSSRGIHCSLRCRLKSEILVNRRTGCWIWTGVVQTDGHYGQINWQNEILKAHRVAFEVWNGPIKDGLHVCHTCDNPRCVNPDHLWLGTHADNVADMVAKGRKAIRCGESNYFAKLTPSEVRNIRGTEGSQRDIAERFGIAPQTVSKIRRREIWKHL